MKDCDAVFFFKDMGTDYFMILKAGDCIFQDRRDILMRGQKGRLYGSRVGVEVAKNGEEFPTGNVYFRIVEEKSESSQQRFDNLVEAFRIYTNNAYTTQVERTKSVGEVSGEVFCENLYFEILSTLMTGLESFYKGEKNKQGAKFVRGVIKEFEDNAINTLGRAAGADRGSMDEFPLYVKRIKKQHFGLFTPTREVIRGIHDLVRDDALAKLDKIVEFQKAQESTQDNSAEKQR